MIYPLSGLVSKRGGMPKAQNMPGFASFCQEEEVEEEVEEAEEIEVEDEEELGWALGGSYSQQQADEDTVGNAAAGETRWVLGTNSNKSGGIIESNEEKQDTQGEDFRQAFVRNVRAVVTRRIGTRARKPTKFFDEVEQTVNNTTVDNISAVRGEGARKIGGNKRYASINVQTLAMKGDKSRKQGNLWKNGRSGRMGYRVQGERIGSNWTPGV